MARIGEVEKIFNFERTASFEWRIPDFSQLKQGNYVSPIVVYFNMDWWLGIRKIGNGIDDLWLNRKFFTPGFQETVHLSIKSKTPDGQVINVAWDQTIPEQKQLWNLSINPPWRIPCSGALTFTCLLLKDDSPHALGVSRETQTEDAGSRNDDHPLEGASRETQTEDTGLPGVSRETQTEDAGSPQDDHPLEDISILLEHLKDLRLSGNDHDFLMNVKDKQFRAHKCVLRARSPVFAAMFRSHMAESADDSVTIDDCDPEAFGEFLNYVYTGKVDISSTSRALGLYYAGDKYDIPRLKEMSVDFLKNSLTATRISDVIDLAVRHDEERLLQIALVYLATHLEEVMATVEWQRFLVANPIQANEMCIKALRCVKKA